MDAALLECCLPQCVLDLLMGKPPFGLQKPACSKVMFVSQNSRIPVNQVIVEWSERKIWVVDPLLVRDASRVTAIKTTGVEVERQQLVFVRPPAEVEISLPYIILAVVALPIRAHIPSVQTKFQRTDRLLNHIVSGIISVTATDLFRIKIPWRPGSGYLVMKFTTGADSGP